MSKSLTVIGDRTLTQEEIVTALEFAQGCVIEAAEFLGIKRWQLSDILNGDKHLNRVCIDILESYVDLAQKNVFKAVKDGHYNPSIWLLERLGKERGFSTKTELTLVKAEDTVSEKSDEELEDSLTSYFNKRIEDGWTIGPDGKLKRPKDLTGNGDEDMEEHRRIWRIRRGEPRPGDIVELAPSIAAPERGSNDRAE
jgi:hypothetical protein